MLRLSDRTKSAGRVVLTLLIGLLLITPFSSCSVISPFCGPRFQNNEFGTGITPAFDVLLNGGTRIYQRTFRVSNVCPDEHVTANFVVSKENINSSLLLPVTIRGYIFYSFLFPNEEVVLANNTREFEFGSGDVDAGLKQQFGDDPAEYFVVLQIEFPTTGSEAQDLNYVNETLQLRWDVTTTYFEYSGGS